MNSLEKRMIEVLKELRDDFGVYEIKAEFEAEGSRMEEMMRLKDITSSVNLPIILKIGGVEAVTDVYNALTLGVKGCIAPMAETKYALSKFTDLIDNFVPADNASDIEFGANIETITACNNFDDMLKIDNINNTIFTVGGSKKSNTSLKDLTTLCEKITKNKLKISRVPKTSIYDIPYFITNNNNVSKTYKWSPKKNINDVVSDTYNWLMENKINLKKYF